MDSVTLLAQAQAAGLTVYAEGDRLVVRGPRSAEPLAHTLLAHKTALMPLLVTSAMTVDPPCPRCGATDWRDTPDAGRWCLPCVVASREPVAALKVHSAVLETEIWVVCHDLPQEAWPTDAPVYRQAELKILTQEGPDTLAWVHPVKALFAAKVVSGRQRRPGARESGQGMEEEGDG